jgi:hypothetical protein
MTESATKTQLAQAIDQFLIDSGLVHDFVKGDKTVIVQGANGPYPSAAGLVSIISQQFDALFAQYSNNLKLITTSPLPIANGSFQLPSKPLGALAFNEARVFIDLTPADFNTDGSLKGDRAYVIEEHANIMVSGTQVFFTAADGNINGCYAVVSYLTINS